MEKMDRENGKNGISKKELKFNSLTLKQPLMKKHEFTPGQSELILNAVSEFIKPYGNAYRPIKHLSGFRSDYIHRMAESAIEDTSEGASEEGVNPGMLQETLYHIDNIIDMLFQFEDARNIKNCSEIEINHTHLLKNKN